MPTPFLDTDLRDLLVGIRQAKVNRDSPLLGLRLVKLRLASAGHLPTPEESHAVLAAFIVDLAIDALAKRRDVAYPGRAPSTVAPSAEEQIRSDFAALDPDLECWSALYFRYLAPRTYQVKQLMLWTQPTTGHGARKQVQRRIQRGIEMLAMALREAEGHSAQAERIERPSNASPRPLPRRRSSFVDRAAILAEAGERLVAGRVLSLVGPPGVGKTRLALQLATCQEHAYPGGIWWVELDQVESANLLPNAIAHAGGLVEEPKVPLLTTTIRSMEQTGSVLLVLDGCEHLANACAALAANALDQIEHLAILVTSQRRLGIDGEVVLLVPTLAVPSRQQATTMSLPELQGQPAIALFVDRAASVQHRFELTPHNVHQVIDVCRAVDGLPLALELAAGRLTSLSLAQLQTRIADPLALLVASISGLPGRQPGLSEVVGGAAALLTECERRLLERLAVFRGGFTLSAAEQVCGTGDDTLEGLAAPVIDALTGLIDKSLVFVEEWEDQVRYRMLHVIEAFAAGSLATNGERAALAARHFNWCLDLAKQTDAERLQPRRLNGTDRLVAEAENILAALEFAARSAPTDGLRLAIALTSHWQSRGQLTAARRWLSRFLPLAQTSSEPGLMADGYRCAGMLARIQSDFASAADYLGRALELSRALNDPKLESAVLTSLGAMADRQGDWVGALGLYEQSLSIWRSLGDKRGEAGSLNNLGVTAYHMGDHDVAQARLEGSLDHFRELGDLTRTGTVLSNLGKVLAAREDLDAAGAVFGEARRLAAALGDLPQLALCEEGLGYVAARRGDWQLARDFYRSAVDTYRLGGDLHHVADWLDQMAEVCSGEQLPGRAVELLAAASMLRERLGVPPLARNQADTAAMIALLQGTLGIAVFQSHWHVGRSLGWERAVDLALKNE